LSLEATCRFALRRLHQYASSGPRDIEDLLQSGSVNGKCDDESRALMPSAPSPSLAVSNAEHLQSMLSGVHVVKAFNTVSAYVLERPTASTPNSVAVNASVHGNEEQLHSEHEPP
jgi:hypothetical protein